MDTQILDAVNDFLVRINEMQLMCDLFAALFIQKVDSIDEAFVSVIVFKSEDDKATNFTNSLSKYDINMLKRIFNMYLLQLPHSAMLRIRNRCCAGIY